CCFWSRITTAAAVATAVAAIIAISFQFFIVIPHFSADYCSPDCCGQTGACPAHRRLNDKATFIIPYSFADFNTFLIFFRGFL
ncbi:MAG: hypothetical protein II341_00060, partial [Oscillospiraceae bacterium]|nr:hypothetical protein [Oscillospiraceae bacterium]